MTASRKFRVLIIILALYTDAYKEKNPEYGVPTFNFFDEFAVTRLCEVYCHIYKTDY